MTATAVRVVPMTTAHVTALMPYEDDMFGPEAWSAGAYRSELADVRSRYYVAAEDVGGALLGWAGVLVAGDTCDVLTVGVLPAARRRGVGRLLLADLLAEAHARGAREAFLEVRVDNAGAIAMYEADGFERIGVRRGYYESGRVDAVTMRRAL